MGRPLGIHFSWILVDFGGQDGAKLVPKSNKSISRGIKKGMPKSSPLEGLLGRVLAPLEPREPLDLTGGTRARPPPQTAFLRRVGLSYDIFQGLTRLCRSQGSPAVLLKPPRGGSTAAQRFRSLERCCKARSLEEQGFEI